MPWGVLGPFTWTTRRGNRFTIFGIWLLIPSALSLWNLQNTAPEIESHESLESNDNIWDETGSGGDMDMLIDNPRQDEDQFPSLG